MTYYTENSMLSSIKQKVYKGIQLIHSSRNNAISELKQKGYSEIKNKMGVTQFKNKNEVAQIQPIQVGMYKNFFKISMFTDEGSFII